MSAFFRRPYTELNLTLNDLTLYQAYFDIHPMEDAWYQTGVIASTIATCLGTGKQYKPSDFMPLPRKEWGQEEIVEQFKALKQARQAAKDKYKHG